MTWFNIQEAHKGPIGKVLTEILRWAITDSPVRCTRRQSPVYKSRSVFSHIQQRCISILCLPFIQIVLYRWYKTSKHCRHIIFYNWEVTPQAYLETSSILLKGAYYSRVRTNVNYSATVLLDTWEYNYRKILGCIVWIECNLVNYCLLKDKEFASNVLLSLIRRE